MVDQYIFYVRFVTHDQALMWDRLERICLTIICLFVVACAESLGSNPTWLFTSLATVAAQVLAIKCWADMIVMARPFENCWTFRG